MKDRDYQKGKIYKLTSNQTDNIYVGSSCSPYLSTRFQNHKGNYKSWLNGNSNYLTSYELLKYDDCKIELIELYPCKCIEELTSREAHFIRTLDCVNKVIPARTKKEYYQENKDRLREQQKEYQKNNKEIIAERKKEYYQEKITCDCDCEIRKDSLTRHKKSQKHIKSLLKVQLE
jgi:hypothetical protein